MAKPKAAATAQTMDHLRQARIEQTVADYATRPVESARRRVQAEDALRQIESITVSKIHDYSITQETPEKWVELGDLVRGILAPIRDAAREGLKR